MSTHTAPHTAERFAPIADVAKTLGNPQRLMLLEHLAQGEHAVEKLAELSGLTIANTSQHLQHLRRANFVIARRSGKHMLYRLGMVRWHRCWQPSKTLSTFSKSSYAKWLQTAETLPCSWKAYRYRSFSDEWQTAP